MTSFFTSLPKYINQVREQGLVQTMKNGWSSAASAVSSVFHSAKTTIGHGANQVAAPLLFGAALIGQTAAQAVIEEKESQMGSGPAPDEGGIGPTLTLVGTAVAIGAIGVSLCLSRTKQHKLEPERVARVEELPAAIVPPTSHIDQRTELNTPPAPTRTGVQRIPNHEDEDIKENDHGDFVLPDGSVIESRKFVAPSGDLEVEEEDDSWVDVNWEKILAQEKPKSIEEQHTFAQSLLEIFQTWFVDSKAPEKGQKYVLSILQSLKCLANSGYDLDNELRSPLKDGGYNPEGTYEQEAAEWNQGLSSAQSFVRMFTKPKTHGFYLSAFCALRALQSADKYPNVRLQYGDFLRHLRNALTSEEYLGTRADLPPRLVKLLENLCHSKFTSTYLFKYWDAFLNQLCGPAKGKITDFGSLADVMEEDNNKLHDTRSGLRKPKAILNLEKLAGTLGASFDPVGKSNVPKKRSRQEISNEKLKWSIDRIAHGTPTIEGDILKKVTSAVRNQRNASISPEFLAFLRAAKRKGEKMLYVNLQQTSGLEADRSHAIAGLQEDPEFAETLYSMALPMDGPEFNSLVKKDRGIIEFKRSLIGLFFNEENQPVLNSPAQLPLDLIKRIKRTPLLGIRVANEMGRIFDRVHQDYFLGKDPATQIDRQDFIMQFYSELTDYITSMDYKLQHLKILDPDHADQLSLDINDLIKIVVQACKDNKDRGGSKNGIDEAKYILLTYPLDDPLALKQALHDLYVNTLGAYTIKFEEILPNRLIYLLSILRRYARLTPEQILKIRKNQPEYFQVASHKSSRVEDENPYAAVPTLETALTQKDSLDLIRKIPPIVSPVVGFHQSLTSTYIKDSRVLTEELYKQLEKDFKRQEIWVDGILYRDAKELFIALLHFDPSANPAWQPANQQEWETIKFLCYLQQGSAKDALMNASQHLKPKYADLDILQKSITDLQKAFIDLRNGCQVNGPGYLKSVIGSVNLGNALTDEYRWESIDLYPEQQAIDPLVTGFRKLCETPEGQTQVLDMLHLALEKGHLPGEVNEVYEPNYIPARKEEIYQTRIRANSQTKTIDLEQDLAAIDHTGKEYLRLIGIIRANPESAVASWSIN